MTTAWYASWLVLQAGGAMLDIGLGLDTVMKLLQGLAETVGFRCLSIGFNPIESVINDHDANERSVRFTVSSWRGHDDVWARIERIEPEWHAQPEAIENAKQFREHPLRRTREFRGAEPERFTLKAHRSEEVLLCFWRGSDPGRVYFSAPWGPYKDGEAFLPIGRYIVRVAVGATGSSPVRKSFMIRPDDRWGISVEAIPS